jgi:hypothetical protein
MRSLALRRLARGGSGIVAIAAVALVCGCGDWGLGPKRATAVRFITATPPSPREDPLSPLALRFTDDEQALLVAFRVDLASFSGKATALARVEIGTGQTTTLFFTQVCSKYVGLAGGKILVTP